MISEAREKAFDRKAAGVGVAVTAGVVLDGGRGWEFQPHSIHVGTRAKDPSSLANGPVAVAGNIVFSFEGLHPGGIYRRRFALQAYDEVEIDVCAFADLRLSVLGSNLSGFDAYCIVTERPASSNLRDVLIYPELVPVAGTYIVPWGAQFCYPGVTDPGFTWESDAFDGTTANVPDPALPGQEKEVKGVRYTTTVADFIATWRIRA